MSKRKRRICRGEKIQQISVNNLLVFYRETKNRFQFILTNKQKPHSVVNTQIGAESMCKTATDCNWSSACFALGP